MAESWSTRKKSSVKSRGAETAAENSTVRKRGREAGGRRSLVVRSNEKEGALSLLSRWRKGLFREHTGKKHLDREVASEHGSRELINQMPQLTDYIGHQREGQQS